VEAFFVHVRSARSSHGDSDCLIRKSHAGQFCDDCITQLPVGRRVNILQLHIADNSQFGSSVRGQQERLELRKTSCLIRCSSRKKFKPTV
jgi:hypothetical protein